AIVARLDSVSALVNDSQLREALHTALQGAADMRRSLTRLALNRGGPRDLGALRAGLSSARRIAALLSQAELPEELRAACGALDALPESLARHLEDALTE